MKKNNLSKLYKSRFDSVDESQKIKVWEVLSKYFFQQYVKKDAKVLDIACGYGEFINSIKCKEKFAIDLNPDSKYSLSKEVKFIKDDVTNAILVLSEKKMKFDFIFCSNFLEHISNKANLEFFLKSLRELLSDTGLLVIMGPNFKYSYKNYWDFFDHHIPLTDKSMEELLLLTNYQIIEKYPKFVPFSTKTKLPKMKIFVFIYLKLRFLWYFFGKQFLFVVKK